MEATEGGAFMCLDAPDMCHGDEKTEMVPKDCRSWLMLRIILRIRL